MKDGFYFVIRLTENEHYCVEEQLNEYCKENGLILKYYRKLKTGHVPMHREVKILGNRSQIGKLKIFMNNEYISDYIVENYWGEIKDSDKKIRAKYTKEEVEDIRKKYSL